MHLAADRDYIYGHTSVICLSCYNPSIGQTNAIPQNCYHRG